MCDLLTLKCFFSFIASHQNKKIKNLNPKGMTNLKQPKYSKSLYLLKGIITNLNDKTTRNALKHLGNILFFSHQSDSGQHSQTLVEAT